MGKNSYQHPLSVIPSCGIPLIRAEITAHPPPNDFGENFSSFIFQVKLLN
jgi:hypothetical protein